jgi:UDP-N-acetylmuramate dehydrogenase
MVIKHIANQVTIAGQVEQLEAVDWELSSVAARHEAADPSKYISFLDLNYEERPGQTLVDAESGTNLTALIAKSLGAGLTGLQWFGGIPGVIGGAVYNNIHGGTHLIGERVATVTVLTADNQVQTINKKEVGFAYDYSRFHQTGEIILRVGFLLTKGTAPELERAEYTFREWVKRKSQMQPKLGSMGSTFQNISQETRLKIKAPTTAAGWLIDQCGLKGKIIGQAQIAPEHANFIVNHGGATAQDVYLLMQEAKQAVKRKFGVDLKEEVFVVGRF